MGRPQVRNLIKEAETYDLTTGEGKALFLKVTHDNEGKWSVGTLKTGESGALVQDSKTREPADEVQEVICYLTEATLHLQRKVRASK